MGMRCSKLVLEETRTRGEIHDHSGTTRHVRFRKCGDSAERHVDGNLQQTKGDRSVAITRSGKPTKDSIDEATCGSNLETARAATKQSEEGTTVSHHGTPAATVVLRGSLEKTSSNYGEGSADEVRH